jgi:uncharacterized protein YcsI (UPF0317 family)
MAQARAMVERIGGGSPAHKARLTIRAGKHREHTAGLAPGYVQGNLCILPADYAAEFAAFCQRNPKPCPLIGMSAPGDPCIPTLAQDLDIRTDVPRYRIFRHGKLADEPNDITDLWRDDLVTFVLGCSFSFEEALLDAGIPLRYIERGENVAMYKSNIDTVPAGRFRGKMVVSMRSMTPADAIRAVQITSRFPNVHGAPVHLGLPDLIGIADLEQPFAGSRPRMQDDEIPVFWACGVTPQVAVEQARPPLCITHTPGCMVITDLLNSHLAVL